MAIKVKHEGNATSRITAAARGGKGKRAAEDARWMAELAAREQMAADQLAQQRAMQTMQAAASLARPGGQSNAPLVSAPVGQAPQAGALPSGGGGGGGGGMGGFIPAHAGAVAPQRGGGGGMNVPTAAAVAPRSGVGGFSPAHASAHAPAISPNSGRGGGGGSVSKPSNKWFDRNGVRYYTNEVGDIIGTATTQPRGQPGRSTGGQHPLFPGAGTVGGVLNLIPKSQNISEYGGFLVGPLGQRYEVQPGADLSEIANNFGKDRKESMRLKHGMDGSLSIVPTGGASAGSIMGNMFELKYVPNPAPQNRVRQILPKVGGGGSGGYSRAPQTSPEDLYDYKLSAEQKNELAKINSALEDARRSGRFSDEELGELERQATAQRMGIRPLPVPREEPPKPTFHTDENGQRWILNGQKWEPVQKEKPEKPKDDFAALLKLTPETRTEMKRNPVTGKDEPVDVPLSMDERLAEMEKIRQMRDKFNAGTPGTGGDPVLAMQAADPFAALGQLFGQTPAGGGGAPAAPAAGAAPEEEDEFAQFLRK